MAEVIKFNMDELKKRITEQTQASFGMLIPDDAFKDMVDKEIKAFFEVDSLNVATERTGGGWGSHEKTDFRIAASPFRFHVWCKCNELIGKKLKEIFDGPAFAAQLTYAPDNMLEGKLSEELEKKLQGMIPQMMAEMLRGAFAGIVQRAKSDILGSMPR